MLRFITKTEVFEALDADIHRKLGWEPAGIHLKTWQDMAVFRAIGPIRGADVAEIGGGASRILRRLAPANRRVNIDKFEGQHGGPKGVVAVPGVGTVQAFLGEFAPALAPDQFDLVYSVSVVEHVPDSGAAAFLDDHLRIMKPGGRAIHAIDLYVGSDPNPAAQTRLDLYRRWLNDPRIEPIEPPEALVAQFHSCMASNPDYTMWQWNRSAPTLRSVRAERQSVSLLLGFRRRTAEAA